MLNNFDHVEKHIFIFNFVAQDESEKKIFKVYSDIDYHVHTVHIIYLTYKILRYFIISIQIILQFFFCSTDKKIY